MATPNDRASAILREFEQAQDELVGKAVILTDGKAGTVTQVWLDELHGLRISIEGQDVARLDSKADAELDGRRTRSDEVNFGHTHGRTLPPCPDRP
jgi:hypothetical protein